MKDLGNPFQEESNDLLTLVKNTIAHPSAAELAKSLLEKGRVYFRDFFNGLGDEASFHKPIKKNRTDFFRQDVAVASNEAKKKVLKNYCHLFSRLFISYQTRKCDLSFLNLRISPFLLHCETQANSTLDRSLNSPTFQKLPFLHLRDNQNVKPLSLMVLPLCIQCPQRHQRPFTNMLCKM